MCSRGASLTEVIMPPGREGLLLTMGVLVLVCHMGPAHGNGMWGPIFYETGPGNLPTDTRINVVVVVDDLWFKAQEILDDKDLILDTITKTFKDAQSWYVNIDTYKVVEYYDGIVDDFNFGRIIQQLSKS